MRWQNRRVPEHHVAVPRWTPSPREIDDLDLLLDAAFDPPIDGFVAPDDDGVGLPITLTVGREAAEVAGGVGALDLIDPEGAPLARLQMRRTYEVDDPDRLGVTGPVQRLAYTEFGPFRHLHRPPAEVHRIRPHDQFSAVVVRRPLDTPDLAAIRTAADQTGRTPLLLAFVGHDMPRNASAPGLVRATLAAAPLLGPDVEVVAVPVADHGSANSRLAAAVASAYGVVDLTLTDEATDDRPEEIQRLVDLDRPPRDAQGLVLFFTGLSGSGKSTLARAIVDYILERGVRSVTSLDGDVVRHHLSKGLGFNRADRETNIARIGFVAAEISRHGGVAVCSPIAPFEATRAAVREMVERAGGGFVLIHVATPLAECERRDRKGLYAKARAGEIPDFTGISSPYEIPSDAIKIDTTNRVIAECVDELLATLTSEGWLRVDEAP